MSMAIAAVFILVGLFAGYYLYTRASSASHTLSDASALISSAFWILAGIFAIMGGFTVLGLLLIVFFSFIAFGKWERLTDDHEVRGSLAD